MATTTEALAAKRPCLDVRNSETEVLAAREMTVAPELNTIDGTSFEEEEKQEEEEVIPPRYFLDGGHRPSKYQIEVFRFIEDSSKGHGVVHAVAGSGKTSTLIKLAQIARGVMPEADIVFLAFNKAIQEELSRRLPTRVRCQTFNSFGLAALTKYLGRSPILRSELKDSVRERDYMESIPLSFYKSCVHIVEAMLERCKSNLYSSVEDVIKTVPPDIPAKVSPELLANWTHQAMAMNMQRFRSAKANGHALEITFSDQIWFPVVVNEIHIPTFDLLFVDETQDVNPCQVELVKRAISPKGGRVLAVGDRFQSIYGFRGAGCHAMQHLQQDLNAQALDLSVCYRCPKKIVAFAKRMVGSIEPAASAEEGTVEFIHESYLIDDLKPTDIVLSRSNAAIVILCLKLTRKKIPAAIRGWRSLCSKFRAILTEFEKQDKFYDLNSYLDYRLAKTVESARKAELTDQAATEYVDCIDVLRAFCDDVRLDFGEKAKNVNNKVFFKAVLSKLESFFKQDGDNKITLSTVHQVKGLEFPKVYVLLPTFSPGTPGEEMNLLYVAITRAKQHLTVVGYDQALLPEPAHGHRYVMFSNNDAGLINRGEMLGETWPFGDKKVVRRASGVSSDILDLVFGGCGSCHNPFG